MGLKGIAKRLDTYQDRLAEGKAEKIKPHHIEKAIAKLAAKESQLTSELEDTTKADKRKRLESKIAVIRELIDRANWLGQNI